MVSTRSASGCSTGLLESYTYDAAGNSTAAGSTTFTYNSSGQLASCSSGCSTITYDSTGRTARWNGWYLTYDGEGRLASACTVSGCATGDKVAMRYDAQGHRVELVTRPNLGSETITAFRYQSDAIAQESVAGTVTRTYVTDEAGGIVKFCDPDCTGSNPQYLVTWNGHGDAASIWKIDASTGALTLANSFTYTTWGAPTTATHNSIADLGFRFLYVGRHGVAWDNSFGLGLEQMGIRHYSPSLGRFLQPDPSDVETNLFAYAGDNPTTGIDPTGTAKEIAGGGWISTSTGVGTWGGTTLRLPPMPGFSSGMLTRAGILAALALWLKTSVHPREATRYWPRRTNSGCWVIGESQKRVDAYAALHGCDTMPNVGEDLPTSVKLSSNFVWVVTEMVQKKKLYDLGWVDHHSKYYAMEYAMTRWYRPKVSLPGWRP